MHFFLLALTCAMNSPLLCEDGKPVPEGSYRALSVFPTCMRVMLTLTYLETTDQLAIRHFRSWYDKDESLVLDPKTLEYQPYHVTVDPQPKYAHVLPEGSLLYDYTDTFFLPKYVRGLCLLSSNGQLMWNILTSTTDYLRCAAADIQSSMLFIKMKSWVVCRSLASGVLHPCSPLLEGLTLHALDITIDQSNHHLIVVRKFDRKYEVLVFSYQGGVIVTQQRRLLSFPDLIQAVRVCAHRGILYFEYCSELNFSSVLVYHLASGRALRKIDLPGRVISMVYARQLSALVFHLKNDPVIYMIDCADV